MGPRGLLPTTLPAPFSATLSLALSVYLRECRAEGSASGQTACPVHPTLRQSQSRHGNASPLRPGCPSPPLLPVWMSVYFLSPWCWTSLPFDFLSVLVVRGGAVCLPMLPSWFSDTYSLSCQNSSCTDRSHCSSISVLALPSDLSSVDPKAPLTPAQCDSQVQGLHTVLSADSTGVLLSGFRLREKYPPPTVRECSGDSQC